MPDDRLGRPVAGLPTPCLLVDLDRLEANIQRMAVLARRQGVALRPHAKTHKSPAIARLQLAAGAVGITVAKVAEAEVFAAAGVTDLFIAYPVIGADKAARVANLVRQGCRVTVGVESEAGARGLAAAALAAGVTIPVRVEVNTGLDRCGVAPAAAAGLARLVLGLPGLALDGIFTFRGASFPGAAGRSPAELGREEGEVMAALARDMRQAGIPVGAVSAGSTPTGAHAAVAGVTEIRPGTYVFNDNMQVKWGSATPDQVALTVLATVVSRPAADVATVDAGSKVFCGDVHPEAAGLTGHGTLSDGQAGFVQRMNEEHGVVKLGAGCDPPIGAKLRFVPNHVCTCVNLADELLGIRDGRVACIWPVAARGKRE